MPTVYDVPAASIIKRTAEYLKENYQDIAPPPWMHFAKTSSHVQQSPRDSDFWFIRCASILRKVYLEGPIGLEHLRKEYGGRLGKGNVGEHKRRGGGSVVRKPLQQLEKVGLVKKENKQGRVVTPKGAGVLDTLSGEILRALEKITPSLEKYK